jgi:hypothetical protein
MSLQKPSWKSTLFGCPRLPFERIRSRLLHPQPEDAPCHGEKDHREHYNEPSVSIKFWEILE